MRWRLRIWRLKQNENEKAGLIATTREPDETTYVNAKTEPAPTARAGDTFERVHAPQCVVCKSERIAATVDDLAKWGWAGDVHESLFCPTCNKGQPPIKATCAGKTVQTTIVQLCAGGCGRPIGSPQYDPNNHTTRMDPWCPDCKNRRDQRKAAAAQRDHRAKVLTRWNSQTGRTNSDILKESVGEYTLEASRGNGNIWGDDE